MDAQFAPGLDYDITDPGTRGMMMLQAFNTTFSGRGDGLMEAYKLGQIEREKRKNAAVQAHSMGLLGEMLNGGDPQTVASRYPLADTGILSQFTRELMAEKRQEARQDFLAAQQLTHAKALKDYEQGLTEKEATDTGVAGDAIRFLMKNRQEMVPTEGPPGPTPEQALAMENEGLPVSPEALGAVPSLVEQTIPGTPLEQITNAMVMQQNPQVNPAAIDPARELVRKDLTAAEKANVEDTMTAWEIIRAGGPQGLENSYKQIQAAGLHPNPTMLQGFMRNDEKFVRALEGAKAEVRATYNPKTFRDYSSDGSRWRMVERTPEGDYKPVSEWAAIPKTVPGAVAANRYQLTDPQVEALNEAVESGRLDPYRINFRTAPIFANMEMKNPGKTEFNKLAAEAVYERSIPTSNTKAMLNTIDPLLDKLTLAGEKLGNSAFPLLNRGINWVKEQTGDADIVAFNNLRDDTVAEIERGLLGTGVLSDTKYLRAVHNINTAQTFEQLKAAVENTRTVIKARLEAVGAGPFPDVAKPRQKTPETPAPTTINLDASPADVLRSLRGQ